MELTIEYIDHADHGGVFGPVLRRRREERLRKAQTQRDSRLLQLSRDIEALEAWHHAWCLEWDVDYRELHPGEWCERHHGLTKSCTGSAYHYLRVSYEAPYEIRRRPAQRVAPELTIEERRAVTRTMAKWGSEL